MSGTYCLRISRNMQVNVYTFTYCLSNRTYTLTYYLTYRTSMSIYYLSYFTYTLTYCLSHFTYMLPTTWHIEPTHVPTTSHIVACVELPYTNEMPCENVHVNVLNTWTASIHGIWHLLLNVLGKITRIQYIHMNILTRHFVPVQMPVIRGISLLYSNFTQYVQQRMAFVTE